MEAQRDPGRQVNTRDRLGGEVLGGEDDQVGCAAVGIVDEGHEVAVVFGGVRRGRGEHGLARSGVAAELVGCTVPWSRSCLRIALVNASSVKSPVAVMARVTSPMTVL